VRDDSAFLKQLSDDPADLATPLVYADWLDDNGASDRAEFLRLQQQVLRLRHRQKGFGEMSRQLLALGEKLEPAWLAVVSRPRLAGTCWVSTDSDGDRVVWRFLAGGKLTHASTTGTYQDSTWLQVGNHVAMEIRSHTAEWEGFAAGDWIRGTGKNVDRHRWRWKARLTTDPKECDVGDPDESTSSDSTD
jgi:uncharacterized protein (TIGR02996 family)